MPLTALRLSIGLAAVLAGACEADPSLLDWRYRFATPELRARAASLEARIRIGGCTSAGVRWTTSLPLDEPPAGAAPPSLEAGRWGFEIEALDPSCTVVARGCADLELPREERATVRVDLAEVEGAQVGCAPDRCRDGRCDEPDAAAPLDAGEPGGDGGPGRDAAAGCGECPPPHTVGACVEGTCQLQGCDPSWSDCDEAAATGCESACPDAPRLAPVCFDGRCVAGSCQVGWSDCDGNPANGCETEGRCTCPDGAVSCEIDCTLGCSASCQVDCTVHCGSCTTCDVSCEPGAFCQLYCTEAVVLGGGSKWGAAYECTLGMTCPGT